MKFTIKAGRKTADKATRMRFMSGRRFYFRFKLGGSCFFDKNNFKDGWNRICGVHFIGTNGSCDLVFSKDSDRLTMAMQVTYVSVLGIYETSILKRLDLVIPERWYRCEILHYKNQSGLWFYSIVVEAENDFYVPISWQMNAPESASSVMFIRHPTLFGAYNFHHDIDIDRIGK